MPRRGAGPISAPGRLVVVEPPDPQVNEVVQGTLSRADERLEWPHADVGSSILGEGRREASVGADVVEMCMKGVYHVARGRSVVDVVCPPWSPECGSLGVGGA